MLRPGGTRMCAQPEIATPFRLCRNLHGTPVTHIAVRRVIPPKLGHQLREEAMINSMGVSVSAASWRVCDETMCLDMVWHCDVSVNASGMSLQRPSPHTAFQPFVGLYTLASSRPPTPIPSSSVLPYLGRRAQGGPSWRYSSKPQDAFQHLQKPRIPRITSPRICTTVPISALLPLPCRNVVASTEPAHAPPSLGR